jgi:hypothetical protein
MRNTSESIETNPLDAERRAELETMLGQMSRLALLFYRNAQKIGNHPFLEFTGLMTEYIGICRAALDAGIDFAHASTHTGLDLPMAPHHGAYLAEKLDCIYGPSLHANPDVAGALLDGLGFPATAKAIRGSRG